MTLTLRRAEAGLYSLVDEQKPQRVSHFSIDKVPAITHSWECASLVQGIVVGKYHYQIRGWSNSNIWIRLPRVRWLSQAQGANCSRKLPNSPLMDVFGGVPLGAAIEGCQASRANPRSRIYRKLVLNWL